MYTRYTALYKRPLPPLCHWYHIGTGKARQPPELSQKTCHGMDCKMLSEEKQGGQQLPNAVLQAAVLVFAPPLFF